MPFDIACTCTMPISAQVKATEHTRSEERLGLRGVEADVMARDVQRRSRLLHQRGELRVVVVHAAAAVVAAVHKSVERQERHGEQAEPLVVDLQ